MALIGNKILLQLLNLKNNLNSQTTRQTGRQQSIVSIKLIRIASITSRFFR
jgi:hypothetical protein